MVIYEAALVVQRHFHALGAVALQKTEVTTTTKAPFLKPMFVEPTGGGVCRPWDPTKVDAGHSLVCNTLYNKCAC